MEVLINDIRWNTEACCKAQILMLNWHRRKGSMVMLEIREMRNVQRWNSKLNFDKMEMFNIETGQWLTDARQLLLHFSRSAMLHHTLFGIGWITYRIGWIVARNRPKVRLLLLHFHQIWCSILLSPFGDLQKKMWCSFFICLGDLLRKKLAVFESVSPIRGYQGCVSYNSLFITFSLQDSSWVQTNHLLEVSILSHTPNHPCLLWQLACCCLLFFPLSWSVCSIERSLRRRWLLHFYI